MVTAVPSSLRPSLPAAAKETERLAFSAVYEEYFAFVWRSARGFGVRQGALDDVVQDAFVIVHRRLHEFEGRSTLRTWISAIVLNVVRHYFRTIQRRSPHEFQSETGEDPERLRADSPDPHEALEKAEGSRLVQRALDDLDDEKREVLVLAGLEELSVPEIAEALDIKLNTAYSRLRLARQDFEQALARHRARDKWRQP
jgi:RNA polymerase sigma-70 factor (ECF subfamily)